MNRADLRTSSRPQRLLPQRLLSAKVARLLLMNPADLRTSFLIWEAAIADTRQTGAHLDSTGNLEEQRGALLDWERPSSPPWTGSAHLPRPGLGAPIFPALPTHGNDERDGSDRSSTAPTSIVGNRLLRGWLSASFACEPCAKRAQMLFRHAWHSQNRFVTRAAHRSQRTERLQQGHARFGANPRNLIQLRTQAPLLAHLFAAAVREAMRLVTRAREQEQLRAVRAKRNRIFLARQVHAVDQLVAQHVLFFFCQAADR